MTSKEIREKFLSFFKRNDHAILPSSSLIPDDPTLLLTAAGMVQFKPIFLGKMKPEYTRIATIQKCVRTTDIENVGHTARHLTFFEMLGNFSFGDYYKKEVIPWAWEFLTLEIKLDPSCLWITIYKDDEEAYDIWKNDVGVSDKRIVKMGEKDNFWDAGPTGPCGPCSEIIYDFGSDKGCGKPDCSVGCDCDRFLEVWNLVFMQYDRDESGKLTPLPQKNIDTGMGLERISCIKQETATTFETDLLKPIIDEICKISKVKYSQNEETDVSIKIIADHSRAVIFLIGDGVIPSNEGRGYILRRLLRRAIRHGRLLGIEDQFLIKIGSRVIQIMKDTYPGLEEHKEFIIKIIESEEEKFSLTLKQGIAMLNNVISETKNTETNIISGDVAFRLYDTFGFPLELTKEMLQESKLSVDEEEFERLMEKQKSKAVFNQTLSVDNNMSNLYLSILEKYGKTEFVGYEKDLLETEVVAIIKNNNSIDCASGGEKVEIILKETPFYGEKGGQIGDKGTMKTETGEIKITDTQISPEDIYVHFGEMLSGSIKTGQATTAFVDKKRRHSIMKNHTATHVLHWALRKVLGEHVKQAGSLVTDKRLRFDFTHFSGLTPEEISRIEKLSNEKIMENHFVKCFTTSYEFAKDNGVTALFGEKYGDFVRVIEVDDFSKELCGGTHVGTTGEIGFVKIISEESVGSNLRRIEALTGKEAIDYMFEKENYLTKIALTLKVNPEDISNRLDHILRHLKENDQELESLRLKLAKDEVTELIKNAKEIGGINVLISKIETKNMETLRSFADIIKEKIQNGVLVIGAKAENKAILVAAVTNDLINKGYHAGNILKKIAPLIDGGGGGRADMAQAGGKNTEKLEEALREAEKLILDLAGKSN
jgi:alanyl-tRNA synthetase